MTPLQLALLGKLAIDRNNIAREQARTLERIEGENRKLREIIEAQRIESASQKATAPRDLALEEAIARQQAIARGELFEYDLKVAYEAAKAKIAKERAETGRK
jgi:hypothetical protein